MNVFEAILGRIALIFALAGTPYLTIRLFCPKLQLPAAFACAGALSIAVNTAIPVFLHACNITITATSLTAVHAISAIAMLLAMAATRRSLRPSPGHDLKSLLVLMVAFACLVIPFTHLAGIDTYKWQGLATNVNVEGHIPWLIHPVSLFGFSPRAYPSAQPLVLATVQIMGRMGVDAGYYWVSLLSGITGISAAYMLGKHFFELRTNAAWFACFYAFSPVFMRYNHWATGRGMFLALYPLFILMLLKLPKAGACVGTLLMALLLALSHKVGLITAALLIPLTLGSCLVPRIQNRVFISIIALPFLALAVLMSPALALPPPAGQVIGFLRASITRFGWMLPFAALALIGVRGWLLHPQHRRLFPAMLVTLPLAYPPDIYGAMMALPFIVLAATAGVMWLRDRYPVMRLQISIAVLALALTGALTIVGHRTLNATPGHVYQAAQFLEQYDPVGPFQVHAPGRARVQIHAYVSGCPRFLVTPARESRLTFRKPPSLIGPPQEVARNWIDFARNLVELQDLDVDWYGKNPRDYYFVIDDEGRRPEHSVEIYRENRVVILKPQLQDTP